MDIATTTATMENGTTVDVVTVDLIKFGTFTEDEATMIVRTPMQSFVLRINGLTAGTVKDWARNNPTED